MKNVIFDCINIGGAPLWRHHQDIFGMSPLKKLPKILRNNKLWVNEVWDDFKGVDVTWLSQKSLMSLFDISDIFFKSDRKVLMFTRVTNISRSEDHSGWHTMNAIGKRQDNLLQSISQDMVFFAWQKIKDLRTRTGTIEDQNWYDRGPEHKNRTQRTRSWYSGPKIQIIGPEYWTMINKIRKSWTSSNLGMHVVWKGSWNDRHACSWKVLSWKVLSKFLFILERPLNFFPT